MRVIFIAFLLFFISLAPACKTPSCVLNEDVGQQLIFGNGGGFRGTERSHLLVPHGCIYFREDARSPWQIADTISRKEAKKLFVKAASLGLWELNYHKPGPVYSYVHMREGSTNNKVTWGPDPGMDEAVIEFYQELRAVIKRKMVNQE